MASRLRQAAKFLIRFTLGSVLLVVVAAAGVWAWVDSTMLDDIPEDLTEYRSWRPQTSVKLLSSSGELIDTFAVERRFWVDLDTLPDHVWQAFVAAEDRRFFEHKGVDLAGIARALVANYQAGDTTQGGSTLTQQLAKNLIVGKEKSYRRKIREAVVAVRLERELDKMQILELYMNYVFLGSGNYGIEAAAQDYFDRPAAMLDAGQAAMIAGLIPSPSRWQPRRSTETAAWRRALVLREMVRSGYLDAAEIPDLADDPVLVHAAQENDTDQGALAFITQARREVRRLFGDDIPFERGFTVHTTIDLELQDATEAAVRMAVDAVMVRQGHPAVQPPGPVDPPTGPCFEVRVVKGGLEDGAGGRWQLAPGEDAHLVRSEEDEPSVPLKKRLVLNNRVSVCEADATTVVLDRRRWVEGAAVVVENATGRIIAMSGGYSPTLEGFVRATQARRQPGSSFKPYVYAAALRDGRHQTDRVVDGPIGFNAGGGKTWSPKNYGGGYAGAMSMRTALAKSANTVAVKLAAEVGPANVARLAQRMGVATPLRRDITMALGTSEVTPMDQALAYATIARMGVPTAAVFIDSIDDVDGRPLGRAGQPVALGTSAQVMLPGGPLPRVLPAGVAYELADMLRAVVQEGTARKARVAGLDRAGKTGTTDDFKDTWFVGFTPDHTISVWIGTDGTRSLGPKETGGGTALPAWIAIAEALGPVPGDRLPVPDDAMLERTPAGWLARGRDSTPPKGAAPLPAWPW